MVIIPNQMHCIIENVLNAHVKTQYKNSNSNGAFQRDAHVDENQCCKNNKIDNDEKYGRSVNENNDNQTPTSKYGMQNKIYGASISDVMDWFKTITTNEYITSLGLKPFTASNNWGGNDLTKNYGSAALTTKSFVQIIPTKESEVI